MTSVRKVKWTNCGRKRFREQQDYITNDNCREVAIEWARHVIKATRTLDRFPFKSRSIIFAH